MKILLVISLLFFQYSYSYSNSCKDEQEEINQLVKANAELGGKYMESSKMVAQLKLPANIVNNMNGGSGNVTIEVKGDSTKNKEDKDGYLFFSGMVTGMTMGLIVLLLYSVN